MDNKGENINWWWQDWNHLTLAICLRLIMIHHEPWWIIVGLHWLLLTMISQCVYNCYSLLTMIYHGLMVNHHYWSHVFSWFATMCSWLWWLMFTAAGHLRWLRMCTRACRGHGGFDGGFELGVGGCLRVGESLPPLRCLRVSVIQPPALWPT